MNARSEMCPFTLQVLIVYNSEEQFVMYYPISDFTSLITESSSTEH